MMESIYFFVIWGIGVSTISAQYFGQYPKPIIKSLHINTDIKYTYANTLVSSNILNPANVAQEVNFRVVIPEEAFITGLTMKIKDETLEAYIDEKESAKQKYGFAVNTGQGAAHVFQDPRSSKIFTVSVNVEPGEKVGFNLTYEELLSRKNKTYKTEINVNPNQIVEDLYIVVNIEDILNIINVDVKEFSMTNEIDAVKSGSSSAVMSRTEPNNVKVEWKPSIDEQIQLNKEGLNGKMVIKYDVDSSENAQQILVDNDGYFVHIFRNDDLPVLNKHVVFVLDLSGSMAGEKLKQLKDAMQKILQDLSESDFFSILPFAEKVVAWGPKTPVDLYSLSGWEDPEPANIIPKDDYIVPASKTNINAAMRFLKTFGVYPGTNILGALRNALKVAKLGMDLNKNSAQRVEPMIIFLTDGQPNAEETNPDRITEKVETQNNGVTIFALGFGNDVDMDFLKKLSLVNGGFARKIYVDSDASIQLQSFYNEISSPVLSNIKFKYLSDQVENVTSEDFKNLYSGSELLVLGKVKPNGTLSGNLVADSKSGIQSFQLPAPRMIVSPPCCKRFPQENNKPNKTSGQLEKMWAYKTIKSLLEKYSVSKNDTIENQAKELALKYSFVTPLTSLVVVKPRYFHIYHYGYMSGIPPPYVSNRGPEAHYPMAPAMLAGSPMAAFGAAGSGGAFGVGAPSRGSTYRPSYMPIPRPPPVSTTDKESHVPVPHHPDVTTEKDERTPSYKLTPYQNVAWLNQTASEEGYLVPPNSLGTSDVIALNETDVSTSKCDDGNDCRHFIFCTLAEFADDISKFIPFKCHIETKFVGVCCPL